MTLKQFNDAAFEISKEAGYKNVTVISGCYSGDIRHCCQIWTGKKHINSGLHNNPESALQALKDYIEFDSLTYDKITSDINL